MKVRMIVAPIVPRTLVQYFFLAVAIVCLGLYGYQYGERALYQTYESREFDQTLESRVATVTVANHKPAARAVLSARGALIGRLSIPRLNLSAMVREGIDPKTLKLAIGHIPATALPGQAGNVGVAGHRDTFFRKLKNLKTGDEIQISTLSGDFKYLVESLVVVEPDNAGALAPSSENVLTMVTCFPFNYVGTAPKRFVVRARQVSPQTMARSSVK
jgi:sortase A